MLQYFRPWMFILTASLLLWACPMRQAPVVEAQSGGFQVAFTVTQNLNQVIIPPCLSGSSPTAAAPCIPNNNQTGHTVTYTWNFGSNQASACSFLLDGSNDNVNWFSLAGANAGSSSQPIKKQGTIYANGYYSYVRVKISPCKALTGTSTLIGIYTGYTTPLPIGIYASDSAVSDGILGNPEIIWRYGSTLAMPMAVLGFDCYNNNNAVAYLFLAYGHSGFADLNSGLYPPIGPLSQYSYRGPPLIFSSTNIADGLELASTTLQGGTTPTAAVVNCTFYLSGVGPFYPLNPVSQ